MKHKERKVVQTKKKSLFWWVGGILIGVVLLGYSVVQYYIAGGDKGFVVCSEQECELAIHWHARTY